MDSVRDFFVFEWVSVAMGCWRWGETSVAIAASLWSNVETVVILISGIQAWVSYHLGQCQGGAHALLFSPQSCLSSPPDGLFGSLVTLYDSSRLGTNGNRHVLL